ncbi:type II and III secretion system protein [Rhodopirellula sallentina SM41]|uniref:Type II and III secretion system protein n=1 Tax=Rhodopirellula sallentina SM41 TaxID=1263870 RepID=M5U1X2_9BACT|nr:type II and III secretion system protein [Rhodopirellula sallentina SM41]
MSSPSDQTLIVQNPTDENPFDNLFGGDGDAMSDDPFGADNGGGAEPAGDAGPAPAAGDPFGDAMADEPAFEAPAEDPAPADDPFGAGEPAAPMAGETAAPAASDDAFGVDDPFGAGGEATVDPQPTTPPAEPFGAPNGVAPGGGRPSMLAPGGNFGMPVGDDELRESGGELLDRVDSLRSRAEGRLRAEVRAQLREARRLIRQDPVGVAGSLKSLLARVESTPDIDPQLRRELMGEVRASIQIASAREAAFLEQQVTLQAVSAGATASARLLDETFRREARLKTLSAQMNALIDEGRYTEADGGVSLEIAKIAGDTITDDSVLGRHVTDQTLWLQTYARDRRYRELRERNFIDAFSLVLKSAIPFVDEPPIVYPDADVWQRLSRRRIERYGAIELVGDSETERRIEATLDDETSQRFPETPLNEAIRVLSEAHDIPIRINRTAIEGNGLTEDTPVDISLENVSLRSFLRLMLRDLELTYMIQDEVLNITTEDDANTNLVTKVYPVGDLVVPVVALGGGMGGGMGGGDGRWQWAAVWAAAWVAWAAAWVAWAAAWAVWAAAWAAVCSSFLTTSRSKTKPTVRRSMPRLPTRIPLQRKPVQRPLANRSCRRTRTITARSA